MRKMRGISILVVLGTLLISETTIAQNVGIGTNAPTEKLHVQGGARITSLAGGGYRLVQSNGTGVLSNIVDGTAGQYLTTNGAGVLSWGTVAADADNGLYFNVGVNKIRLGGALVEATTITQGGFQMTYNLSGTGDFIVQDNGTNRFEVLDNGRIEMPYTLDATGAVNTGVLEIANTLRLDGDEIITNANTTLYLQNDNNGNLIVDATTFNVNSAQNVVGLSAMPAAPYALGAGVPVHTIAYPIEIGSDGNGGLQATIGYFRGSDVEMNPELNGGWGYVGYNAAGANEYWWRMYAGGFINASQREIKRNIHTISEESEVENYVVNSIRQIKPSLYNYNNEYDEMKPGLENHYRPAFRIGLIADETPDYILDEGFSGVDIYGLATLSLVGVQHNLKAIDELQSNRTVQDFGSVALDGSEIWVSFSEDFEGQTPIVTVTSNNPNVTLSVVSKSNTGFLVKASKVASDVQFDWIAMAKKSVRKSSVNTIAVSEDIKNKMEVPVETKQQILDFYENFNSTLTPNNK